jgi:hypothetical protein
MLNIDSLTFDLGDSVLGEKMENQCFWMDASQKCYFQINIEAMESGTTGIREATVMMLEKDKLPATKQTPIVLNSGAELFERLKSTAIKILPSDDEQYDHLFPEHPLSKVRKRLDEVIKTLKLEVKEMIPKPFRVQRGWKFWK